MIMILIITSWGGRAAIYQSGVIKCGTDIWTEKQTQMEMEDPLTCGTDVSPEGAVQ